MGKPGETNETEWPVSWIASRNDQLLAMAGATPVQLLEWLEQAMRLAQATGALPRADGPDRMRRRGIA